MAVLKEKKWQVQKALQNFYRRLKMKKVKKFIHLFKERIIGFWLIDDINVGDIDVGDIDVGDEFQDEMCYWQI